MISQCRFGPYIYYSLTPTNSKKGYDLEWVHESVTFSSPQLSFLPPLDRLVVPLRVSRPTVEGPCPTRVNIDELEVN